MKITRVLKAVAAAGALALMLGGAAQAVTLNLGNGGEPGSIDPHKASGDWKTASSASCSKVLQPKTFRRTPILGQSRVLDRLG